MLNLIKADFYRIIKDKLFLILCIIAAGLSLVMVLLNVGMMYMLTEDGLTIRTATSALTLALAAFGPFSDYGLVLAILFVILLMKDVSNGTIRNKIIMGKSRMEIFASNMIVCVTLLLGLVFSYSILTFMFGCVFFQPVMPNQDAGQVVLSFLFAILGWTAMAMVVCFFTTAMKNAGLAIVAYVIIGMVCYYAGVICSTVSASLIAAAQYGGGEPNQALINVLNTITHIDVPYALSSLGGGGIMSSLMGDSKIDVWYVVEYIPVCVALGGASFGFGYLIFRHKDIK